MPDELIGKDKIAEALRYADALVEEHNDLPGFWRERGIDAEGITYVAMQHGLRQVMIMKGMSPNVIRATAIPLNSEEKEWVIKFAGAFMTGFATHAELQQINA